MRNLLIALCIILLLVPMTVSAQSNLTVEVVLNNTSFDVKVSGQDVMASSDIVGLLLYASPPQFYISSYLSGLMVGLASPAGSLLFVEGAPTIHTIGLQAPLNEPVYLAFTEGDWNTIDKHMVDIESGRFLRYISPSFAYALGTYHPLTVVVTYPGIDIDGTLRASKGIYKLVIENMGQSGGRPLVMITG